MKNNILTKIKDFIHYEILKKGLFTLLSDRQFAQIDYFLYQRKFPNIDNPQSFSEKLQWIKVYGGIEGYAKYVDKYEVRNIIEELIGKEYLIPSYGAWDRFEDIDFKKLPERFVLKGSHGSGYIYICKDKSKIDLNEVKKITDKWMNEDFYKKTREIQYKYCKPKIVSEIYLEDENGELIDYKIFCFNGKPQFVEVMWGRFTDDRGDVFMDLDWKKTDIVYIESPKSDKIPIKPSNLSHMLEIAEILSKEFPFVRVDLYSLKGKTYFGELTFVPSSGTETLGPKSIDIELGKMIDISKYPGYMKYKNIK